MRCEGKTCLIESTSSAIGPKVKNNAPRGDWEARRLGAAFTHAERQACTIKSTVTCCLLAVIPVELGVAGGSGQGATGSVATVHVVGSVQPLAQVWSKVSSELES